MSRTSASPPPTIFITGASSGIGRACATAFSHYYNDRGGCSLLLVARRHQRLEALAAELQSDRCQVFHAPLDVRERHAVETFFSDHRDRLRNVNLLVNNAGLSRGLDGADTASLDHWDEMIDTNLKGTLYCTRLTLPTMVSRGSGHIINIGSISGRGVYKGGSVYCATKHGLRAFTEALRLDLVGSGIRVSSIDPGMVETEFSEVRFEGDRQRAAQVYENTRALNADNVAQAVLWAATQPEHVNIQEVLIMPTDQAAITTVHRTSHHGERS